MAKTYTGSHKAIVKEFGDGQPYILFELLQGEEIPMFRQANIGFTLERGTTYEEAQAIARQVNEKLVGLLFTKFG
jgi:hypothetical protein